MFKEAAKKANLAVSFKTSWIASWLAMTSHKPISLTARLMVFLYL